MKLKHSLVCAALAAAAIVPSAALAQDAGFYLGGSIGQSMSRESCDDVPISCNDKDTAFRLFGGYQFNRFVGVELGYADLGTPASANGTVLGVPVRLNVDVTAWDLVAVGTYPINRFFLYGKAGLYYADTESSATALGTTRTDSDTNTDLTFGAGAGFSITNNLKIRAEWQRYQNVGGDSTGEDDIDVFSVGLLWRF